MAELFVALIVFLMIVAVAYVVLQMFPSIPPPVRQICVIILIGFALIYLVVHVLPLALKAAS